jgi:hypothetical protein
MIGTLTWLSTMDWSGAVSSTMITVAATTVVSRAASLLSRGWQWPEVSKQCCQQCIEAMRSSPGCRQDQQCNSRNDSGVEGSVAVVERVAVMACVLPSSARAARWVARRCSRHVVLLHDGRLSVVSEGGGRVMSGERVRVAFQQEVRPEAPLSGGPKIQLPCSALCMTERRRRKRIERVYFKFGQGQTHSGSAEKPAER